MSQGIFGIVDFNRRIERPQELAVQMARFLQNSGSKKAEISYAWDNHYILGMKRICVTDYQQAEIARSNDHGSLCLIHGEYHNYHDVLQRVLPEDLHCEGDLELALQLYRLHGPEFARKLNGLFCFAVLDQRERSLILLNDRFGMAHQVYWTIVNGRFYFATHLKTLLACPGIQREIDPDGLNLFLKYSYIPSPWTIFKSIKKLPPGHMLVFRDGTANTIVLGARASFKSRHRTRGSNPCIQATLEGIYLEKAKRGSGNLSQRRFGLECQCGPGCGVHGKSAQDVFHWLQRSDIRRAPLCPDRGPTLQYRAF